MQPGSCVTALWSCIMLKYIVEIDLRIAIMIHSVYFDSKP